MTSARIEAAARADYNLGCGLAPDAESNWDELPDKLRAGPLARAGILVAAIDAADDRIRLTLPEFNDIRADAVGDLNRHLHQHYSPEQLAAAQDAGIPDTIEAYRVGLADRYLEPVNFEEAMGSLIRERLGASLRSTAEFFDHASLEQITCEMRDLDLSPLVSPQFQRRFIQGCSGWLRTRADELAEETRIPYRRVDTRPVIDEDRHTALLSALAQAVARANRIAETHDSTTSFIMTDRLVEVIQGVGVTLPTEA